MDKVRMEIGLCRLACRFNDLHIVHKKNGLFLTNRTTDGVHIVVPGHNTY